MVVLYVLFFIILLSGIFLNKSNFFSDYIDRNQCDAIKGIFILLIFFSHISRHMVSSGFTSDSSADQLFLYISRHIGQWVVALFLFYSGYGVMESLKKKGESYLKGFPKKRILTTLLNFDVAVCCFFALNLVLGLSMSWEIVACSLIGWSSIGNSNWYIFVILICYTVFYVSSRLSPNAKLGGVITTLLLLLTMIVLSQVKEYRFYNTIL